MEGLCVGEEVGLAVPWFHVDMYVGDGVGRRFFGVGRRVGGVGLTTVGVGSNVGSAITGAAVGSPPKPSCRRRKWTKKSQTKERSRSRLLQAARLTVSQS
jgi:hypothetical protein